ncbi:hypothetical protein [Algirhabdus cladophorae]|uniref:hypothetical protein n=1 Tax=Algirhabdus cladophorae TaxID=3377108 RepID=UPI003B848805
MRTFVLCAALALTSAPVFTTPAEAGVITRACMQSDRKAANRRLCSCIQYAANKTLTKADQRVASKFFKDPHKAQEIRQSDRSSHERFWLKYKQFGKTAEAYCS